MNNFTSHRVNRRDTDNFDRLIDQSDDISQLSVKGTPLLLAAQTPHFDETRFSIYDILGVCVLIITLLLTGCGSATPAPGPTPATAEIASIAETAPTTPRLSSSKPVSPVSSQVDEIAITASNQDSDALASTLNPTFSYIAFAENSPESLENGGDIESTLFFTKGITKIHAIFNYDGMWPEANWERVWYLNDKEVARLSETWDGPQSGQFDYFITNKDRPLPAGDWLLELYVEDELKGVGAFVIDEAEDEGAYPLAYTKCRGDHHDIYVSDTDGSFEQLVVTNGAGPSWAPGGGAIFFYGESGVDRQVREGLEYVFDGLSNGVVAVSTDPLPTSINQLNLFQNLEWKQGTARWANVSPDGSMIAYDAAPLGDYRIYFLGTEANQQFRYEIPGEQADWSPDSQHLVYRSGRDGKTGLWVSNRDDSSRYQLTSGGSDSFPAWSPEGQTIAFSRDEGGNVDIYAVNVDGSNLRRLTTAPGHDTLPAFMPNGEIIFRSARTGSWSIWKMAADGTNQTEIIADACVGNDWALSRIDIAQ